MKRIICTGNREKYIAYSLNKNLENITFVSRNPTSTDDIKLDLSIYENITILSKISLDYDIFINNSLLVNFGQTLLLQSIWTEWFFNHKSGHIINFGSAVDYNTRPDNRLYSIEKKSLRELNKNLSLACTWENSKIRTTYLSFGGISTDPTLEKWPYYQHMDADVIAKYVKHIIESPDNFNIDEIHITPIQPKNKKDMEKDRPKDLNPQFLSGDTRNFVK